MIHDGRGKVEVVDVFLKGVFRGHPPSWQGPRGCLVREGVPGGQGHLGEARHDGWGCRGGGIGRPGTVAVLWLASWM